MKMTGIKHCALVFLIFTFVTQSQSQVDQAKLNSLKSRYPWGSVYLTNKSLLNLECILKDNIRRKTIVQEYGEVLISRLQTFIQREKGSKINESVAFVEIDLNRIEAGYKKITDSGGEIVPLSWSKEDVVNIAHLCDRQLNAVNAVEGLNQQIHAKASIQIVWEGLTRIQRDPYASSELVYALARSFRVQLNNQEVQLNELKTQNATIYESVIKFKRALDGPLELHQQYFSSREIELQIENAEFMERVAKFERSIKETTPVPRFDLASAIATLQAQLEGNRELYSAPSRLQTELRENSQVDQGTDEVISTLYEHKEELPEIALERAALLAFAIGDYRRSADFVDTGLKQSPRNERFLATLGLVQYDQSLYPQALTSFQQALSSTPVSASNFKAALIGNEGLVQWRLGETKKAETSLTNSIAMFRGDVANQEKTYLLLAQADLYADYGQSNNALKAAEEALRLIGISASDKRARIAEGRVHRLRAKVALFRGNVNEANREIETAIKLHQNESSSLELAQSKDVQSDIEEQTGKHTEALKTLFQAANLYKDANYIKGQSENQLRRANLLIALNEFDEAERLINEARIGFAQLNYKRGVGECEVLNGVLILRQANHKYLERFDSNMSLQEKQALDEEYVNEARPGIEHFEKAIKIFDEIGYKRGLAYARDKLAINLIALVEELPREIFSQAEANSREAARTFENIGDKRGQAVAYGNLGIILRKNKQYELALDILERALQICINIDFKLGIGRQFFNLGRAYYERNSSEQDRIKAKEYFHRAQEVFKETQAGQDELKQIDKYLADL